MSRSVALATAVLLVLTVSGCPSKGGSGGSSSSGKKAKLTADAEIEKLLAEGKAEAREWLSKDNHAIFKYGNEATRKLVDELYEAGTLEVVVTGMEKIGDGELAAIVVAKMPANKDSRAKLLAIYNKLYEEEAEAKLKDEGQKWLEFVLD